MANPKPASAQRAAQQVAALVVVARPDRRSTPAGSAIAATPAACSGAAAPTVRKSCTLRIAPVSARRRDRPPDPPAGDGVGLRQRVDGDRAVLEARDRRRRHVAAGAEVVDVLVDLVGEARARRAAGTARRSSSSSSRREHLAGRVVRRVDDDRAGAVGERGAQLGLVDAPVGLRAARRSAASRRTGSRRGRSSRRTASKTITSSPGSTSASIAAIIASVEPQVTQICVSGSTSQPG